MTFGLCRTCRRLGGVAQPLQTLYIHKIHRWKFIRIWKNVSIRDHLQNLVLMSGFLLYWYDQLKELSCFIKFRAHTAHSTGKACVLMYFWGEGLNLELADCRFRERVCVAGLNGSLSTVPSCTVAVFICGWMWEAGSGKNFMTDLYAFKLWGWEKHGHLWWSVWLLTSC